MSESVTVALVVMIGVVVLGIAWLCYLANGGKPVRITIKGMGIEVDIARPGDSVTTKRNEIRRR